MLKLDFQNDQMFDEQSFEKFLTTMLKKYENIENQGHEKGMPFVDLVKSFPTSG